MTYTDMKNELVLQNRNGMKLSEFFKTHDWVRYSAASDKDNNPVMYDSPEACKWCVVGAMWYLKYGNRVKDEIFDKFWNFTNYSVSTYNDRVCKSKEELINLLEKMGE